MTTKNSCVLWKWRKTQENYNYFECLHWKIIQNIQYFVLVSTKPTMCSIVLCNLQRFSRIQESLRRNQLWYCRSQVAKQQDRIFVRASYMMGCVEHERDSTLENIPRSNRLFLCVDNLIDSPIIFMFKENKS